MEQLSLSLQTLYADLLQSAAFSSTTAASIYVQSVGARKYYYAREKHGEKRLERYLGPAEDPDVLARVEDLRATNAEAKRRRSMVSLLKRAGLPAPSLAMGRVLEAVANAGLFSSGLLLVGTAAYQVYSPVLGVRLSLGATLTQDVDLAVLSLAAAATSRPDSLLGILHRADPTFVPRPSLERRALPGRFRSRTGLQVELITQVRKRADEERSAPLPDLAASAQSLRYLEYLTQDPVPAVALYGSGVRVRVPQPARYAVHKLIVAQVRSDVRNKRAKDLEQARELLEALSVVDAGAFEDALEDARARGPRWRKAINASLKAIGYREA
jgi:hypothetical protein